VGHADFRAKRALEWMTEAFEIQGAGRAARFNRASRPSTGVAHFAGVPVSLRH
jgi:hypothetical protein